MWTKIFQMFFCYYPHIHVKSLAKAIMIFDLNIVYRESEESIIKDNYKRKLSNNEILNNLKMKN